MDSAKVISAVKCEAALRRVQETLQSDLLKESKQWAPPLYLPHTQTVYVSVCDRDRLATWLSEQCCQLRYHVDTLCLAVTLLDRCVSLVRVRVKYAACLAITCLHLAAKLCEEDECVGGLRSVIASCQLRCSCAEVRRLERVLLDKLQWQPRLVTALSFLPSLHVILLALYGRHLSDKLCGPRQLPVLASRLARLMTSRVSVQLSPSQLALSLLASELRRCCHLPGGHPPTALLRCVQMTEEQLDCACESISCVLPEHLPSVFSASSAACLAAPAPCVSVDEESQGRRRRRRVQSRSVSQPAAKRHQVTAHVDDFVLDIRRLYASSPLPELDASTPTQRSYADAVRFTAVPAAG